MSTILDARSHGFNLLFRDAVRSTERALRKRWGFKAEIPLLSHALSLMDDNGSWHVRSISGQDIAICYPNGKAILVEDLPTQGEQQEICDEDNQ